MNRFYYALFMDILINNWKEAVKKEHIVKYIKGGIKKLYEY